MPDSPRDGVSVLLPTLEWGPACEELADQIGPTDELLLICDRESDPVAGRETPEGVAVLTAGDPEGCSGKANALAYGMEQATNDRFVWTDDDFLRESDWLDRLVAAGERHGPATVIPEFVGTKWWRLFEPPSFVMATLTMYLGVGAWAGNAWGGGVTFARDDIDVAALVADLRSTLSDDGTLSAHLGSVRAIRSMRAPVRVPGELSSVIERMVRLARITHVHEGVVGEFVVSVLLVGVAVLAPLLVLPAVTLVAGVMYALLGIRRWTFLLAYPALLVLPLVFGAGMFKKEFEWSGRRYRLNDVNDIEIVTM